MKQLLEKLYFEFQDAPYFSYTLNKETSSCCKNVVTLWHNIAYIVNSIASLLDITIMINISQEINKVLYKKMLTEINWYWFHNDASEKK